MTSDLNYCSGIPNQGYLVDHQYVLQTAGVLLNHFLWVDIKNNMQRLKFYKDRNIEVREESSQCSIESRSSYSYK